MEGPDGTEIFFLLIGLKIASTVYYVRICIMEMEPCPFDGSGDVLSDDLENKGLKAYFVVTYCHAAL